MRVYTSYVEVERKEREAPLPFNNPLLISRWRSCTTLSKLHALSHLLNPQLPTLIAYCWCLYRGSLHQCGHGGGTCVWAGVWFTFAFGLASAFGWGFHHVCWYGVCKGQPAGNRARVEDGKYVEDYLRRGVQLWEEIIFVGESQISALPRWKNAWDLG